MRLVISIPTNQHGIAGIGEHKIQTRLLHQSQKALIDLEEMALEDFSAKLAVIGPFESSAR